MSLKRRSSYVLSMEEAAAATQAFTAALSGDRRLVQQSLGEIAIARARSLYMRDEIDVPELEILIADALALDNRPTE